MSENGLDTLAPGFLISAPQLEEPDFARAVLLVCAHGDRGAMGLVINRAAPLTLHDVMKQLHIKHPKTVNKPVLLGGPVAGENGAVLYQCEQGEALSSDELWVSDELRLCLNQTLLQQIGAGSGPERFDIFVGHAGWGPGQLERELAAGSWIPAKLRYDLLFEVPVDERWEEALQGEGLTPAMLAGYRGPRPGKVSFSS